MEIEEFKAVDAVLTGMPQSDVLAESTEAKSETAFGIRIGSLGFLVSSAIYCEVLDKVQVNAFPNVHPWLSGIVNLRGNLVPVFDLRIVLGEDTVDHNQRRLFAIGLRDSAAVLWIDRLPEIKEWASMQQLPALPLLPQILQRTVIGGYKQNGQVWLAIGFENLFKSLGQHQYLDEEMAA